MQLTRRKTLALLGGGVIVAATAASAYAVTRLPEAALAPWDKAGGYDDPRMRALSYAILAPNPHNRQPWMVDLSVPDQVTLFVDTNRLLPHTDPFNRQIVIGLGCLLEVMRLAALEDGLGVTFDLFPEGESADGVDGRPVAVARFAPTDEAPDPLFAQVLLRRTLKDPFDLTRPVPSDALDAVEVAVIHGSAVGATNDMAAVAEWRDLTHQALVIEFETPHTYKESVDLFRIGRAEVNANPDGIDFSGPLFETLALTGLMTREAALDMNGTVFRQGMDSVLSNSDTAMAHVWLVTDGNTRADQIMAGRDWVRLNLAATGLGLGVQPLSQALQEYPEMAGLYADVHERLAGPGQTVQMFARLGYAAAPLPSPRWPLENKIINA
jgi:hypothetical protein